MLEIQKLDKRMSGYGRFKYRVEFPVNKFCAFGEERTRQVYKKKIKYFNDCCEHLTKTLGFGPYVDYSYSNEAAKWGFRLAGSSHVDTIYLADEQARDELQKILNWFTLKE